MRALTVALAVLVAFAGIPAVGTASAAETVEPAMTQDSCAFPYTATDATGTEVTVDAAPERVVTTQASAAQVMWDIGAREKVVGMPVRPYTSYLEGSEERTDVLSSDGFSTDVETVVSLEPDLVLVPNGTAPPSTLTQLREAGLTVFVFERERSVDGIYEKIERFGRLTGECDGAEETVATMREEVETIRTAVEGRERPRALYTFYNFTAGQGTFIDSVLTNAGAQNVAAEAGISGFEEISRETVAAEDPEWVVVPSDAPFPTGPAYNGTTAYREGNRVTVDTNLMNQPGPRVVTPMRVLAETFHPEAFPVETTTTTTTSTETTATETTTTATTTTTTTTETTTEPTTADGPGFGVGIGVAALAAAALLARRRSLR